MSKQDSKDKELVAFCDFLDEIVFNSSSPLSAIGKKGTD